MEAGLVNILQQLNLQQYMDVLVDQGVDDIADATAASRQNLEAHDLKPGHANKLYQHLHGQLFVSHEIKAVCKP